MQQCTTVATKFQLIWRTSVFRIKFPQNTLQDGVLGQIQPENNLIYVIWQDIGGFMQFLGDFKLFLVLESMLKKSANKVKCIF